MGFSFDNEAFRTLKAEIAVAGGNIQPIKVRPLPGHDGEYEIVFGHRRHRACFELGLPVLAVLSDLHDSEMWLQMERENRARADLSPYEQGMHYQHALDAGLFPSNRKLAEAIGVDLGQVGKVLALARLHDDIVAAFKSPADIQVNWSKTLTDAADIDPAGTRARGRSIAEARAKGQLGKDDRPRSILDALTGGGVEWFNPRRHCSRAARQRRPACGSDTATQRWRLHH